MKDKLKHWELKLIYTFNSVISDWSISTQVKITDVAYLKTANVDQSVFRWKK